MITVHNSNIRSLLIFAFVMTNLPKVALILVFLCHFVFVTSDDPEKCYRGDAHLEFENPCFGDPGQPAKYDLCSRGRKLKERCKGICVYCSNNTYQDTFTNCTTCLPCITDVDCPKGQEIIKNCTAESNAECGCPPQPCPKCEPCTPVQTESSTDVPDSTAQRQSGEQKFLRNCPTGVISVNKTGIAEWEEPQATDGAVVIQSHHPGESFKVGNTTVIYVFMLGSNNIFCSFVVIRDTKDPGEKIWWHCFVAFLIVILLVVVVCSLIICWRKGWPNGQDAENRRVQRDGEGSECNINEAENDNHERIVIEYQERKQEPRGNNSQGTSEEHNGSNEVDPTSSSEAEKPPTEAVYGHDDIDNDQEGVTESLMSGEKHQSTVAPTKNNTEEHPTPASAAQNSTAPMETIEADGTSQEPAVQSIKKNVVLDKKAKESSNLSHEAGPTDFLSGKGVVPHSGRYEKVKEELYDRQESVSHKNKMETTFQFLSRNLTAKEWRGVGRRLGIRDAKLLSLKHENESIQEAIYDMFIHWKQVRGSQASFAVLMEALKNEDRKDLADDLRRRKEFEPST